MRVKEKTLAQLASKGDRSPRRAVCRVCLTPETFARGTGASSLRGGQCADRAACEKIQPPLWAETG